MVSILEVKRQGEENGEDGKTLVVVTCENHDRYPEQVIKLVSKEEMEWFIKQHIKLNAAVSTNGYIGYIWSLRI